MPQVLKRSPLTLFLEKIQGLLLRLFGWDVGPYS
jgi:hypothetical protein